MVLALNMHGAAFAITEVLNTQTGAYNTSTYLSGFSGTSTMSYDECSADPDYCWRAELGKCVHTNDNGYSALNKTCSQWCEYMDYNVYVYTSGNEFGCACAASYNEYLWKDEGTGRERQYQIKYTLSTKSKCRLVSSTTATSTYRCKKGYYGTASSGCTACPANATCSGGTGTTIFKCDVNYYKNGNGCTACPGSKTGTNGFWYKSSGSGVRGETYGVGATSITECYLDGLNNLGTLCDSTGCFELTDECFYSN